MTPLQRILNLDPAQRAAIIEQLTPAERATLAEQAHSYKYTHNPQDAYTFLTDTLQETTWSKPRQILTAINTHNRIAVPAGHALSKTHTAARIAVWWSVTHPPGTTLTVTTAPTFRQVRNILWPHIRRLVARHNLPGKPLLNEWKIGQELIAYGFSGRDNDEAAVQGIHAPNLLIIVDEAGGIPHQLGDALESITTGDNTKLLLIGNPPTDEEGSWFEKACNDPTYKVIPMPSTASPNITGEPTQECKACPPNTKPHNLATHLVDQQWITDQIRRFGKDSNFVQARVYARFVTATLDKVIPYTWAEAATHVTPTTQTGKRLGVDVASDGGDELVIALNDNLTITVLHRSSGADNANQVNVAGKIMQQANDNNVEAIAIDAIGIGRGTADILQKWKDEGKLASRIIPVNVAAKPRDNKRVVKGESQARFINQRAEMWWTGRELIRKEEVKLPNDPDTLAQLAGPKYTTTSAGLIQIESKESMKRRGIPSPDIAEAILLSIYEPPQRKRSAGAAISGVTGSNTWGV